MAGELGLHPVSTLLNVPMAQLLVAEPMRNKREPDARQRSMIPIRHGAKVSEEVENISCAAFDLTSLYVLEHLNLLEPMFAYLQKVILSRGIIRCLFYEKHRVLFHQPSRVEKAKRIHGLIIDNTIQVLPKAATENELPEDVGAELALLLHKAQELGGRVVATLPIFKVRSLGEEVADLDHLAPYILKTTDLLRLLEPYLSKENYDHGMQFLASVDRGDATGDETLPRKHLYIDNLALQYLDICGVLPFLKHLNLEEFVDKCVDDGCNALISAEVQGENIARQIDRIRQRVADGVLRGNVTSCGNMGGMDMQNPSFSLDTLRDIIETVPMHNADIVFLDDRNVGRHQRVADDSGNSVAMVGPCDGVNFLFRKGVISEERRNTCRYRMLKSGFSLLPIEVNDILPALKAACQLSNGDIIEDRNLMAIRQNGQRVRSVKMLRIPDEGPWFMELVNIATGCLRDIWNDENMSVKRSEKLSDWLLYSLSPLPVEWSGSMVTEEDEPLELNCTLIVHFVMIGTGIVDVHRRAGYAKWVERRMVQIHFAANESLLDEATLGLMNQPFNHYDPYVSIDPYRNREFGRRRKAQARLAQPAGRHGCRWVGD